MTENTIVNEYFPEIELGDIYGDSESYGILNVTLTKSKNVLTGYVWKYSYYAENGMLKVLSSYDLIKLRGMVEEHNQKWIIFDLKKATETYALNRKFQEKHKALKKINIPSNRRSASGVRYVYKLKDNRSKNGFYWCYRGKNKSYSTHSLTELYEKVTNLNLPWKITDENLFKSILEKEKTV